MRVATLPVKNPTIILLPRQLKDFSTQIELSLLQIMDGTHTFSDFLHLFVTLHSTPNCLAHTITHTTYSLLCGVLQLDLNDTDIVLFSVYGTRVAGVVKLWSSFQ